MLASILCTSIFLSTLSLRRATASWLVEIRRWRYFYPRSPCGERRRRGSGRHCHTEISIHALLAESDAEKLNNSLTIKLFLSTLSLRRATIRSTVRRGHPHHFYPRSPCGERHYNRWSHIANYLISIHALLAESDGHPSHIPWR